MSLDAYAPCPCGSGKKSKFCCHAVAAEMEKVERYQQGHNPRLALQALDAIDRKHPHNAWAVTARAEILLQDRQPDEATEALEPLIREQPDHKYAIGLMALASFSADGYDLAKPAIHRAFQRCSRDFPTLTANLAMAIAGSMMATGRFLAARAHLALALGMAPDEKKAEVFRRLMEFDGNRNIPFPLRSVHNLAEFTPADDKRDEARKAHLLSLLGCWRPAAKILSKLAEEQPGDAALWCNVGLCRAWDGDEALAALALHKAAGLHSDRETAVEWETLAQLLDQHVSEDRVQVQSRRFDVNAIPSLIAALNDDEWFSHVAIGDDPDAEGSPAALYLAVDRPRSSYPSAESLTLDTVPNVVAHVTLYLADDEGPQRAFVTGAAGDAFDAAVKRFVDRAGILVSPVESADDDEDSVVATIPRETSRLSWQWDFPLEMPLGVRRRLESEMWQRLTMRDWPDAPLSALGGKSPRQAAGDAALAVALRAAVNVLDAQCDQSHHALPGDELLRELGVEPPQAVHFDGESSLTSLQLKRVAFKELDDDKLALLLQRAVLIRHGGYLYQVLREVLQRPGCLERYDTDRMYATMAELCSEQRRRDEALQWIARGRDVAKSGENAFQRTLRWMLEELTVRLDDPGDPEIMPLLRHIGDHYLPKIPELRNQIDPLLESCGVTPPWADEDEPEAAGVSKEGLWWPQRKTSEPAGKKLWLPGQ